VHPVAVPWRGRGGRGVQRGLGARGGRGSKYSNIDGHSGSRLRGYSM
jgi:hypothetical protein